MNARLEYPDRQEWRRAAADFDDYSYRQVWDFGLACARRLGAASQHVAIRVGTERIGLADVRIKRLPLVGSGIAYVNGGPLVRRCGTAQPERLQTCLEALLGEYTGRRGLLLRVLAPLGTASWNAAQRQVFADLGFVPAAQGKGYRTLLLAIDRPAEQIRRGFDQKWRNCLNRSERNGLTIRSGSEAGLLAEFCELYHNLLERKRFEADLDADFYAAVQEDLERPERFLVSLADLEGRTVAGHVASALGDTCVYLLGASNAEGLASKASYLLQWHAIRQGQQRGCRWYDLGGIDPEANPGVYHFKQGLAGADVQAPGPFEKNPSGLRRHLVRTCERVYRSVRALPLAGGRIGG